MPSKTTLRPMLDLIVRLLSLGMNDMKSTMNAWYVPAVLMDMVTSSGDNANNFSRAAANARCIELYGDAKVPRPVKSLPDVEIWISNSRELAGAAYSASHLCSDQGSSHDHSSLAEEVELP